MKVKHPAFCLLFLLTLLPIIQAPVHAVDSSRSAIIQLRVYPDGVVELAGEFNYTSPPLYPYKGPAQASFKTEVTKEDSLFRITANGNLILLDEVASQFPFNSTKFFFTEEFSQNISRTSINGSIIFPERWAPPSLPPSEEYPPFDFNVFPFNSTDFTVSGEYSAGVYRGALTLHMIPGLTLGDVEINLEGNATHLAIYDSVEIFYNQTLPIPDFTPPDKYMIREILPNKMFIDQLLYEMTGELITCEEYNVTIVQTGENSDKIYFHILLRGDFINILVEIYKGLLGEMVPLGREEVLDEAIRDLINATMESVESASFRISYARVPRELSFSFTLSVNWEKMSSITKELVTSDLPPEFQSYIKAFLSVRHAKIESCTKEITYENGELQYNGNYVFKGDLNAEINLIKRFLIISATKSPDYVPQQQMNFVNKTEIVDVSNFNFEFNQRFEQNVNVISISFQGIKIAPPLDPLNATCFKLGRFFDFTHELYKPETDVRIEVLVEGGSNGTHTVVPLIDVKDPEKPPTPDKILPNNVLVWNNVRAGQLRGLIFKVYGGLARFVSKEYVSPDNPYTIDALDIANCQVAVNDVQGDVVIMVKNVTLPENVEPPPETYKVLGSYVQITSEGEVSGSFTIRMYYDPEELAESGVSEDSLTIYFWNSGAGEWTPVETHLNSEEHYVWANVNHLSIWTLMGEVAAKPIWAETWFMAVVGVIVLVIALAIILVMRRRVSHRSP